MTMRKSSPDQHTPLLPPRQGRSSAIAVAFGLHGSDASFRFLIDFSMLGFLVLAIMNWGDIRRWGSSVPGLVSSSTAPGVTKDRREATLSATTAGLNLSTVAAPRPDQYPLTPAIVASAPATIIGRLSDAVAAYSRHESAVSILDRIKDLDPEEPNTGLVQGLAAIALGGRPNAEIGLARLRSAALKGHITSQALYGLARLNPPALLDKDQIEGRHWLERAAGSGDIGAEFLSGYAYLSGWMGVSDPVRGAGLIKKAADGGHVEAMRTMASLYLAGQGVPKDIDACEAYLRKAMAAGDVEAQGLFGAYLLTSSLSGWGTSMEEAAFWLRKAAESGNPNAMNMLGLLHVEYAKEPPLRDIKAGVDWFERCSRVRSPLASCEFALGYAFENGQGRRTDLVLAAAHYQAAGRLGSIKGREAYERLKPGLNAADLNRALAQKPSQAPLPSNNSLPTFKQSVLSNLPEMK